MMQRWGKLPAFCVHIVISLAFTVLFLMVPASCAEGEGAIGGKGADVTGSISGVVLDASSGEPIHEASIHVSWAALAGSTRPGSKEADTDSEGRFEIGELPIGQRLRVSVSARGYASGPSLEIQAGGEPLRVELTPGGTIRGTVRWETEPVRGRGWVSAEPVERGPGSYGVGSAAWEDAFELVGLRAGTYVLRGYFDPVVEKERIEITVGVGEVIEGIELPLVEGGSVQVTVRDAETGEPAKGVPIELRSDAMRDPVGGLTDAEGQVTARGLRSGKYHIQSYGRRGKLGVLLTAGKTPIEVVAGQQYQVGLEYRPPDSLRGKVVDASGSGIAGATVSIIESRRGRDWIGGSSLDLKAVTESNGGFELHEIPLSSTNTIRVEAPGYVTLKRENVFSWVDDLRLEMVRAGSISGRVTDGEGNPLRGVRVRAVGDRSGLTRIEIDSRFQNIAATATDGTYRVGNLAPNIYTVQVKSADWVSPPREGVRVAGGEETTGIDFVRRPGSSVSGRVVEKGTDRGVAGLTVFAGSGDARFSAPSTGGGRFTIRHLLPGTYRMGVAEGELDGRVYQDAKMYRDRIVVGDQDIENVTLEVVQLGSIAGRVLDSDGKPVSGATLGYRTDRISGMEGSPTKEDGEFELGRVPPGDITILVELESHPVVVTHELALKSGEQLTGIDIVLEEGGTIQGTVADRDGNPVSGAAIDLSPLDEADGGARTYHYRSDTTTAEDGTYRLDHVPPGKYRIYPSVRIGGHATHGTERVEYVENGVTLSGIDMQLDAPPVKEGFIKGIVVNQRGEPIKGCRIERPIFDESRPEATGAEIRHSWHDGRFEFEEVIAGTHEISVHPPAPYAPVEKMLVVAPTDEVRIVVREDPAAHAPGSIAGTVVDARTGEAIERFSATLTGRHPREYREMPGEPITRSYDERNGRFQIDDVPPRRKWFVRIEAEGYLSEVSKEVELEPGGKIEDLRLRLERPAVIAGTVSSFSDGEPIEGAEIRAWNVSETDLPTLWLPYPGRRSGSAVSDREGRFTLGNLGSGSATIRVKHADYAPEMMAVATVTSEATTELNLRLHAGGTIEGMVVDHAGKPFAGARVHLGTFPFDYLRLGSTQHLEGQTNADGEYRIEHVPPGDYVASVDEFRHTVRFGSTAKVVAVLDSETTELNFTIAYGAVAGTARVGGEVAGGYTVTADSPDGGHAARSTASHSGGRFDLKRIPVGDVVLRLYSPDGHRIPVGEFPVTVQAGETVKLELSVAAYSISGFVASATTGNGIGGAQVILVRNVKDEWGVSQTRRGETDPEGRFSFEYVIPDEYVLQVTAEGYGHAIQPVRLTEEGSVGDVRIALGESGSIEGRIINSGDESQGPADVWSLGLLAGVGKDAVLLQFELSRVRESKFRVTSLAPGVYTVLIGSPRGRVLFREGVEVTAGETTAVELDARTETAQFRLLFEEESGSPVGGVEAIVHTPSGTPIMGVPPLYGRSFLGALSAELPRDIYEVQVGKEGYRPSDLALDLRDVSDTYEMTVKLDTK